MTVVIAGCGDVGTEIGLRFAGAGRRVRGIRRSADMLPAAIEPMAWDFSREPPPIPSDTDLVIIATSADNRSEEAYRNAYVNSLRHVLDGIGSECEAEPKVLMLSSTAVYDVNDGGWVDEQTPAAPRSATGRILLEAEQLLHERHPQAMVLRLAGLYGPGRMRLPKQVQSGAARVSKSVHFTNRIHRDDAAAAVVHLTGSVEAAGNCYIGVDEEPVDRTEVLQFLAGEMGARLTAEEATAGEELSTTGKRCSNALLKSTGFRFKYPTYREGYRAVLNNGGTRHG